MTTDNPDPLEVWKAAFKAWYDNDSRWSVAQAAAAAIIAQHYAPVIAKNERLRRYAENMLSAYASDDKPTLAKRDAYEELAQALGAKP